MLFNIETLQTFPTEPGVYLMKNQEGVVLYIGKAKNLKVRIKQYFIGFSDTREMIPFLLAQVSTIQTILTFNEKEALILENQLIKQHRPKYNVLLKDDKTFTSLMVTHLDPYPTIKLIRYKGKKPEDGLYFGPYPSSHSAKQTLELLQKIFPLRQCSNQELARRKKPCLLYDMKRCLAPCVQKCTDEAYQEAVQHTIRFLKGKEDTVLQTLKKKIDEAAEKLEFEQAAALFSTYQQVKTIYEHHQLTIQMQVEDCDSIGFHMEGGSAMVVLLKFREGKLVESASDFFSLSLETPEQLLQNYLIQHYEKNRPPKTILIPFLLEDSATIEEILTEKYTERSHLILPLKGNKKKLVAMAQKNALFLFSQRLSLGEENDILLSNIQETLKLSRLPLKIECFDTSNLSSTHPVAAMVVSVEGQLDKKSYRLYKIRKQTQSDDYTALKEVLFRRYERALKEDTLPDLIVIDGGKGQLNLAEKILKELNIVSCDLIAIAKENSRHDKGMTQERIFTLDETNPIELPIRSSILFFLQKIRDETHRMAIQYHRKLISQSSLKSHLDEIPGIGPQKRKKLLSAFGSFQKIAESSQEEWTKIGGLSKKDCEALDNYLKLLLRKKSENL